MVFIINWVSRCSNIKVLWVIKARLYGGNLAGFYLPHWTWHWGSNIRNGSDKASQGIQKCYTGISLWPKIDDLIRSSQYSITSGGCKTAFKIYSLPAHPIYQFPGLIRLFRGAWITMSRINISLPLRLPPCSLTCCRFNLYSSPRLSGFSHCSLLTSTSTSTSICSPYFT